MKSNISKKVCNFVESLYNSKSKQQEKRIIQSQLALIQTNFRENQLDDIIKKQLLIKSLFIHTFGFNIPIIHIQAIKLSCHNNLKLKRVGYLLSSILFTQQSQLSLMMACSFQKDLTSENQNNVIMCLTVLPKIITQILAKVLFNSVMKLLVHKNSIIRKKSLIVISRIHQISPQLIDNYQQIIQKALIDQDYHVMAISLNQFYKQITKNKQKFQNMIMTFVLILQKIIDNKYKDNSFEKQQLFWIEIKILKILSLLCKKYEKQSQYCYTIVKKVLEQRFTNVNSNKQFSLLYQYLVTATNLHPHQNLFYICGFQISNFLQSECNNIKYLGIDLISKIYKNYPTIINQYKNTIFDCLKNQDETLINKSLQILLLTATKQNINTIFNKIFELFQTRSQYRIPNRIINKISHLIESFELNQNQCTDKINILSEIKKHQEINIRNRQSNNQIMNQEYFYQSRNINSSQCQKEQTMLKVQSINLLDI